MKKYFFFLIFVYFFATTSSLAATNLSVSLSCEPTDKFLNFDKYSINPDVVVNFSKYFYNPDYTVKVVDRKLLADVVVEDEQLIYDYLICPSKNGLTIKISEISNEMNLKIKIMEYSHNPDFEIYFDSEIFSLREAIVIAVLQKSLIL